MKSPIAFADWSLQAKINHLLVSPIADAFLKRRELGIPHPVHDFLFTYYNFSTSKLKNWVPALDQKIVMPFDTQDQYPWLATDWFCLENDVLSLNPKRIPKSTYKAASFIGTLCNNILKQTPRFHCFGLHEWAMVYKTDPETIRHQGYHLRLPQEDLNQFVKSQTICCSHYDAYRFFTEEAKPLNVLTPLLETRLEMEQGGCLHANMDLYKWATRLWPWIGSDLITKTFMLALDGRELDMRASPYDLKSAGYSPIQIETEEGRALYQKEQRLLAERAAVLRNELATFCKNF